MIKAYHSYFIANNEVLPAGEFSNSLFRDAVSIYEVVRLINKRPLFLKEHIERLYNTAKHIQFDIWLDQSALTELFYTLCKHNKVENGNVEIILSNDYGSKNYYALFIEDRYPSAAMYHNGVACDYLEAIRKNPEVKTINLDLREQSIEEISRNKLYEVILINDEGFITEGSRSNIFFLNSKGILTAPAEHVLSGITREKVLYYCRNNGIEVVEDLISPEQTTEYDACFITGTSPKVLPVKRIGKKAFNTSNFLLQKIIKGYNQMITQNLNSVKPWDSH